MVTTFTPTLTGARIEPAGATTPSLPLSVKRATVTFDRTWSPYIQGTLICRRQSAADATATDPRLAMMTKLTMANAGSDGSSSSLTLAAWLRSRVSDYGTDEATLTFASVESLLQDDIDLSGNQYSTAVNDTTVLTDVLSFFPLYNAYHVVSYANVGGSASFSIPAANAGWEPGVSRWDAIDTMESPKGLWVRGDETGVVVQRMAAGYTADTTTHYLYGSSRILSVVDTVSRDSPDWANSVFINYTWNNGLNTTTDYGVVGTPKARKSLVINRDGKMTTSGEALQRATRMNSRGRTLTVRAISDYSCRPNQNYWVGFQDVSWFGIVRAVTFNHPDGVMDVTIDVTES